MNDIGHLYILANSAMPGLVKIGKTTRSPTERANELSSATGLPTPFIVVYEQLFGDCSAAESFVHTYLATKGFRVADNREFFSAPVNEVVRAIALAPGAINSNTQSPEPEFECDLVEQQEPDELDDLQFATSTSGTFPWESVLDEAEDYYYGTGDKLEDFKEAMRMFSQAAKLGSLEAYSYIGKMHKEGEGTKPDKDKALMYFKEGARKGNVHCYWAMGMLFHDFDAEPESRNLTNAEKCFSLFLKNMHSDLPDGQHLTSSQLNTIYFQCASLLNWKLNCGFDMPSILSGFIAEKSCEIREGVERLLKHNSVRENTEVRRRYEIVLRYLQT